MILKFIKKPRIYLDTSVISHLYQPDARKEWQDATIRFWKELKNNTYIACISRFVLDEILNANQEKQNIMFSYLAEINYEELKDSEEVTKLAQIYIDNNIIPVKYIDDAKHIAIATISNCDVVASWNFKHMVKYTTITLVNGINKSLRI